MTVSPSSPDITTFDISAIWDLSSVSPVLRLVNNSVGPHLNNCRYWFEAITAGGISFHLGSATTPDIAGAWVNYLVPEPIPQTLGHIQWSGGSFVVKAYVKDSANTMYQLPDISTIICRPGGNDVSQADNFGDATLHVETKCELARLYVEDQTAYSYNGLVGAMLSKVCRLFYPVDPTGAVPDKKEFANVNNMLFPVAYSGDGFQLYFESIYQYDYSPSSSVRFKYKFKKALSIRCNIDLCPLIADIERMERDYQTRGCTADERDTLLLINSKLGRLLMAKMQPLCGVDVSDLLEEIKTLGNFTCDCYSYTTGINPVDPLQGEKGDPGIQGIQGIQGPPGVQGPAGSLNYKEYTALMNQTSTNAPTNDKLYNNTLGGVPVYARTSAGVYTLTLAGAFPVAKTFIETINQQIPIADRTVFTFAVDDNTISIIVRKISDGSFSDLGLTQSVAISIKVYN